MWRNGKYWTQRVLDRIDLLENTLMATLADLAQADTDLAAEVTTIGTDVQTALTKLSDVEAQLAALQAGGLTPTQQAAVDAATQAAVDAKTALAATDTSIQTALNPPPAP